MTWLGRVTQARIYRRGRIDAVISTSAACPGSRFSSDTDEDLLFYMALKQDDQENASLAWGEFFERHWKYLLGICMNRYGTAMGDLGVEDLVKDTFIRAYRKAATFKPAASGDADARRRRVRAWLGRIANRLFLAGWRKECQVVLIDQLLDDGVELPAKESSVSEDDASDPNLELVQRALTTLAEREREVLVASYAWYDKSQGWHRMPDSELAALAAKYQTTPVNIRKIRSRAKEKVEDYVNSSRVEGRNDAE